MAIYTGVANANGDFTVPFSSSYTSGEKITVTAEKDSALKTIELFAPSETTGGGVIQFTGSLSEFPANIGGIKLGTEIAGVIGAYCFAPYANANSIFRKATGLELAGPVTEIRDYAFYQWDRATSLILPSTLTAIGNNSFNLWSSLTSLTIPGSVVTIGASAFANLSACKTLNATLPAIILNSCFAQWVSYDSELILNEGVTTIAQQAFQNWNKATALRIPSTITSIQANAFAQWSSCDVVTCLAAAPPTIQTTTFSGLKSTCIFKVPAGSVAAYQAAPNWSTFAARIQAI